MILETVAVRVESNILLCTSRAQKHEQSCSIENKHPMNYLKPALISNHKSSDIAHVKALSGQDDSKRWSELDVNCAHLDKQVIEARNFLSPGSDSTHLLFSEMPDGHFN